MYKTAVRSAPRRLFQPRTLNTSRRFLNTAPPAQKSRSWKSSAARWGLAAAGVYYYNTSNVFAEEPEAAIQRLDESIHAVQESNLPTIDAIVEEKRQRQAQAAAEEQKRERAAKAALAGSDGVDEYETAEGEEGMDELEDEAGQQGAFNPETGEINWDCPCLGGMAHGPCGEEFKAAFSCFVYSDAEPKGVECIDKFKGMQDCFRLHPEMYASELEDDEVEEELEAREAAKSEAQSGEPEQPSTEAPKTPANPTPEPKKQEEAHLESSDPAFEKAAKVEYTEPVPKESFDATS